MPLSTFKTSQINTIEIASVAGVFNYTFKMEQNNTVQILWSQVIITTDATIGARRMVFVVQDESLNVILSIPYFLTTPANGTTGISFFQGNTVIPSTVLGLQSAIPVNGVFVKNDWIFSLFPLPAISAGDIFTGNFQTKGLHNSAAKQ